MAGGRSSMGEIVEVEGGHIVRSIGRKDRHSKVCTAKGPRDRRVRLAAQTAIQFYDVQDRLGYDRPSKAVDWLIKKAQAAIDELAQLPAWHPAAAEVEDSGQPSKRAAAAVGGEDEQQIMKPRNFVSNPSCQNSSFLPPSMDSDAMSFFPVGGSGEASSSHSQDLKLSLQSFQEQPRAHEHLLLNATQLGFDSGGGGWADHTASAAVPAYFFNPPPPLLQQLFSHNHNHNHLVSQRGPLQSSNTPSIRAWIDPPPASGGGGGHHHQPLASSLYPPSFSGIGYSSNHGGFHIPARIQGDEEEHDGYSGDKPSSASSDSHH